MNAWQNIGKGLVKENPTFRLLLGFCPTIGVTTTAIDGLGMGVATLFVLVASNAVVALIKDIIPDKVRIPSFVVIIAAFVTIVDLLMSAYTPALHEKLGIFIPLIVVNCIILARAESFASKNRVLPSILDGLGMGIGFTLALVLLGAIREALGGGTVFGHRIYGGDGALLFVLAPGGFLVLGYLIALINILSRKKA